MLSAEKLRPWTPGIVLTISRFYSELKLVVFLLKFYYFYRGISGMRGHPLYSRLTQPTGH